MKNRIFKSEELGTIRTICNEQGDVLFCAKDVAEDLGYKNTRDAIFKHVDDDDKTAVAICDGGSNYKTKVEYP